MQLIKLKFFLSVFLLLFTFQVFGQINTVNLGGPGLDSDFITEYTDPPPLSPMIVCEGDILTLTASGGVTYKWTGPNQPQTSKNPLIIPNASAVNAGTYYVEVVSASGSSVTQSVNVTVNLKSQAQASNPNPSICRGAGTTLSATGGVAYSWSPAAGLSNPTSANPYATPTVSTLYTVNITNSSGCVSQAQLQVNVKDLPVANAGTDKKITSGRSVKLDGGATGNILSYSWSPVTYLDNPNSPTPIANPTSDITYTLTVTSTNGCGSNSDNVLVQVYGPVTTFNAFTPNGDGVNDVWNIKNIEPYPQCTVTIFNRNGTQVFQSTGYATPWDGKYNGSDLPVGAYTYVIDLKDGITSPLGGTVTIIR